MPRLSVVLITFNEAEDLPACIESVRDIADEIVVLDGGSSDGTPAISEKAGAKVFRREFDSYSSQKNCALSLCSNEWVLSLDPDERVSPELRSEISALLSAEPQEAGFKIPYTNFFLGRKMRFGGLAGEKHLRLFRKSKTVFGGGLVHEGAAVDGKTGGLKAKIIHHSYPDLEEYLRKFNLYTTLAAKKMSMDGKKFSRLKLCSAPLEFAKRYFLRLGFLDGFEGFVWAVLAGFYVFVKYAKLRRMEKGGKA